MLGEENHDFAMERRLRALDPELHRRFTDAVFALRRTLSSYQRVFPDFTDHTELHSITVIGFCNELIGGQIDRLNADELYSLLMGCYLHDVGMGICRRDFDAFSPFIDFADYFDTHSREDFPAIIRDFHSEFSGLFIRKYSELLEIPTPTHLRAIVQIARGHRRTDLMDEEEYPLSLRFDNGHTLCLPYLAALIRLADEIDVTTQRNPILLYDLEALTNERDIIFNKLVRAIRSMEITEEAFVLYARSEDEDMLARVRRMVVKMQRTLDVCRAAVTGRTPYEITQKRVLLEIIG